jgi:hypothetical protein
MSGEGAIFFLFYFPYNIFYSFFLVILFSVILFLFFSVSNSN